MPSRPDSSRPPFRSRRRHPRIAVLGEIQGRRVPLDMPITVRDLSLRGFSAESAQPFPPGTRHQFQFTKPDGPEILLEATAIHCRIASATGDGQVTFVSGFEFVSSDATDAAVASLIDTITSVLAGD